MSQELKEKIRKQVRQAIAEKVNNQQNKSESKEIVSEGMLHRTLARLTGSAIGGYGGLMAGIAGNNIALPFLVSTGVLVPPAMPIAMIISAGLIGAFIGHDIAKKVSHKIDRTKIEKLLKSLEQTIDERDIIVKRLEYIKDENELKRLDVEFTKLTQEQIKIAQILSKEIEKEKGILDPIAYRNIKREVLPFALDGKLSYVAATVSPSYE